MFIYTAINARGTQLMALLGIPFFLAALLMGLAFDSAFRGAYLLALFSPLVWSFAYTGTLRWFNGLSPARPAWQKGRASWIGPMAGIGGIIEPNAAGVA